MEIGVFSRTYEVSDYIETCERMKKQGITHTQLNLSNAGMPTLPMECDEKKIMEIKKISKTYGIQMDALSGTFNMIDPDEEARKRGCRQFKLQCEIANMLNIPIVSLCTGSKNPESKWKWSDDNQKQSAWDDLMYSTESILRVAEDNHIILGVEPEQSNVICTPQKARKYIDDVGSETIKIIMDGANLLGADNLDHMEEVFTEAFDLLGKDIVLAHAKDISFHEKLSFVAAGQGNLNFAHYIGLLKKINYNGPLIMHGLSEIQVPKSMRFLEEHIGE